MLCWLRGDICENNLIIGLHTNPNLHDIQGDSVN
jgi:hypothetical protein